MLRDSAGARPRLCSSSPRATPVAVQVCRWPGQVTDADPRPRDVLECGSELDLGRFLRRVLLPDRQLLELQLTLADEAGVPDRRPGGPGEGGDQIVRRGGRLDEGVAGRSDELLRLDERREIGELADRGDPEHRAEKLAAGGSDAVDVLDRRVDQCCEVCRRDAVAQQACQVLVMGDEAGGHGPDQAGTVDRHPMQQVAQRGDIEAAQRGHRFRIESPQHRERQESRAVVVRRNCGGRRMTRPRRPPDLPDGRRHRTTGGHVHSTRVCAHRSVRLLVPGRRRVTGAREPAVWSFWPSGSA
jgi:hypothetical protein